MIREARSVLDNNPAFLEELSEGDAARAQISRERIEIRQELFRARRDFEAASEKHTVLYKEEQAYRQLKKLTNSGETVYPPILELLRTKKRGAPKAIDSPSPKKTRINKYLSQVTHPVATDDASIEENLADAGKIQLLQDTTQPAMSIEQINRKISGLENERTILRNKKDELKSRKQSMVARLEEINLVEEEVLATEWEACVRGRNIYASRVIQLDFAAGMEDLAREDREEDDEAEHPIAEASVINMAESLPVFCVSSQGYQKFTGQLEGEQTAALFSNLEDTGITQLRAHIFELGKAQLDVAEETLLNACQSLMTSLRLWSTGGQVSLITTNQDVDAQKALTTVANLVQVSERILLCLCNQLTLLGT